MIYIDEKTFEKLSQLTTSLLDIDGKEVNNPVSMVKSTPGEEHVKLKDQIKRILRTELSDQIADQGGETFEEANDFDVEDSFDQPIMGTHYEEVVEEFLNPPPEPVVETTVPPKESPEGVAPEVIPQPAPTPASATPGTPEK